MGFVLTRELFIPRHADAMPGLDIPGISGEDSVAWSGGLISGIVSAAELIPYMIPENSPLTH